MERVTISELKNRLSAYIQKVRAGQTVVILDRDQPVARLEQIGEAASADDRLSALERAGALRRAKARVPINALRTGAPRPTKSVVEALLEERQEAR